MDLDSDSSSNNEKLIANEKAIRLPILVAENFT